MSDLYAVVVLVLIVFEIGFLVGLLPRLNEELASLKRQAEYVEREIARIKEKEGKI